MDRTAEIKAQIEAHNLTIKFINQQVAELEAELAQIEADRPKPFILREITPEMKAKEAAKVNEALVDDVRGLISTEVHNIEGTARTTNGRGGAKAAQTRKINQLVKKHSRDELAAALEAAKNDTDNVLHYTKATRNARVIPSAEKAIAYRLGL